MYLEINIVLKTWLTYRKNCIIFILFVDQAQIFKILQNEIFNHINENFSETNEF